MVNDNDKTFYAPGDVVLLRLDIPNKPKMLVVKIERSLIKKDDQSPYLRGVKCRWFTTDGLIQEAIFSTKDLIKV